MIDDELDVSVIGTVPENITESLSDLSFSASLFGLGSTPFGWKNYPFPTGKPSFQNPWNSVVSVQFYIPWPCLTS